MHPFISIHRTTIIACIVTAIVFFMAGMQYKAYQIRTAVTEAFQDVGKAFSEWLKTNSAKEASKVTPVIVPASSTVTLTGAKKDSQFRIGVLSTGNLGKEVTENRFMTYTADKNFLTVTLAAENVGKAPDFVFLSDFQVRLPDGTRFAAKETKQSFGPKTEGYSSCISCTSNPWDLRSEVIVFDGDFSLTGATLIWERSSEEVYEFAL